MRVRVDESVDRQYLLFHLLSNTGRRIFAERARGSSGSMVKIDRSMLEAFPIPLPPTKAEQEAIAEVLSDADALIESLEQVIAKKRQVKQGAMQELLTGKRRLPGFSGEWEVKRLEDVASIQRGASPRPIDSPIWFDENSSVGWVRISDVTKSGIYLRETTQRLSPLGIQYSRPISRGSLIMSICATVGRPVITEIEACIHDGFVVFDNLRVDKQFLYYILKAIEGDWSRHGQTGSQMNLNTGMINRTEVLCPPLREQTAIAAILSDMDAEIAELEAKLAKARQVKQGMMQELLTGRIRLV
jgi:type I restriction enzyme S subunit